MYKVIRTERLLIRPIAIEDKEFIYHLVNSDGWKNFIGDKNVRNIDDAEKYILKILGNEKYFYSVFEIYQTKQPIGIISFLSRDNQEFPDLGFALLPEFEKRGYAFEASRKYLDEIINVKMFKKIIGITVLDNKSSIQLLKRLGMDFQSNYEEGNELLSLYSITL